MSYVEGGILHVRVHSGEPQIVVGSPSWMAWLTDPRTRSFSFRSPSETRCTVRKERRSRGSEYWVAYRRRSGKLRKVYLGQTQKLTLEKLNGAAAVLASTDDAEVGGSVSAASTGEEAGALGTDVGAGVAPTLADVHVRERSPGRPHEDLLLLTKLSIPSARTSPVARPRLNERLQARRNPVFRRALASRTTCSSPSEVG